MTKKSSMTKGLVATGVGLAAASVAAVAGGYMLYGSKDASKNRKKVKGWMLKAKGEILEKIESLENISEDKYHAIVDTVSQKYGAVKNVDGAELAALVSDAKKHWKVMHAHLSGSKSKGKKTAGAKKPAKSTTAKR